jgi:hypothetical protein
MTEGATISDLQKTSKTKIHFTEFADDTNLLGKNDNGRKSKHKLIEELKAAFSTWEGLLHATGHSMETSKCACYLVFWAFQDDGYAYSSPFH